MQDVRVFPSVLAADLGRLREECQRAEAGGADGLHLDIMDGQFVPNISLGFAIIKSAREWVNIPLTAHLMIMRPDQYAERCVEFGADTVVIHQESPCDVPATLAAIRSLGARAGITLNPETAVESIGDLLDQIDEVLIMSVHPGFGGQSFMPEVLPKLSWLREKAPELDLAIDGGIDLESAALAAEHGANVFGVGTSMFRAADMSVDIKLMRDKAAEVLANR